MTTYRAFKLAVGGLLALLVAGYAVGVTVNGGVSNPAHPKNQQELERIRLKFAQATQSADEILGNIMEDSASRGDWNRIAGEEVRSEVVRRIERHRSLAARTATMPDGHRISFGSVLDQDMAESLSHMIPDLVDIEIKCVLMREPFAFEFIGASKVPPEDLMRYLVKIAHDQGWLIVAGAHIEDLDFEFLSLFREDREVFAAILAQEGVFEGAPTVVYYSHVGAGYDEDEISDFNSGFFEGDSEESYDEMYDEAYDEGF